MGWGYSVMAFAISISCVDVVLRVDSATLIPAACDSEKFESNTFVATGTNAATVAPFVDGD